MSYVGAGVFAEWRIIPEDVIALAVFTFVFGCWFVVKLVFVSAVVKCFLVGRCCSVEGCFVRR